MMAGAMLRALLAGFLTLLPLAVASPAGAQRDPQMRAQIQELVPGFSKAFRSATAAIAVDHGKLKRDDRVVVLAPGFQLQYPRVTREFRLVDTMSQGSGLPYEANDKLGYPDSDHAQGHRSPADSSVEIPFTWVPYRWWGAGGINATALVLTLEGSGARLQLEPWDGRIFEARLMPEGALKAVAESQGGLFGHVRFPIDPTDKFSTLEFTVENGRSYPFRRK